MIPMSHRSDDLNVYFQTESGEIVAPILVTAGQLLLDVLADVAKDKLTNKVDNSLSAKIVSLASKLDDIERRIKIIEATAYRLG